MSTFLKYQDKQLFTSLAHGDQAAMKTLFDRFYPRLYYFAIKLTKDKGEAQDLAQEALLALWQRKELFANASCKEAEAFMITVVRNKAYNFNKHLKVRAHKHAEIAEEAGVSEDLLEAQIIQEDIFNRIYEEIQALAPGHIALIRMIFIEGLETSEIAQRLHTTPNNVRNQKARALEKLKNLVLRKGLTTSFFAFLKVFSDFL